MSSPPFFPVPEKPNAALLSSFQRPIITPLAPTVLLAIITSRVEDADTAFDCVLFDWEVAGLQLPSAMRSFLFTKPASQVVKIGHLSDADWREVQARLKLALAANGS